MSRIQLAACAIIENNKILLLFKKLQQHYEFPGGKVEINESLPNAAVREAKEEIGVDVKLVRNTGNFPFVQKGQHYDCEIFLSTIISGKPSIKEPDAFEKLLWVPLDEIEEYLVSENVRDFCKWCGVNEIRLN